MAATPSTNQWNADGTGYTILSQTALGTISSGNQGWAPGSFFLQRGSFARAYSYAAFAQATYTPEGFDAFHLTVGGRYTRDKRNGTLYLVQGKSTNFPFTFENNRFDPMVTAAFDATDTIHLYAKYSTGYRAGGANDRSQTFAAFGPEAVKAYEIGSKMDLFEHRVRLNLAGYIMDRTGTQIDFDNVDTNPASPTYNLHTEETRNAPGTSKIRGVEADLTVNPTDGLTLGASYAYTYTNVPLTPNPFLGNALTQVFVVYTPRNAASAYADYEVPLPGSEAKVRFHLDGNYADPAYSFQNETTRTDKTFVMNGRIALADLPLTENGTKMTVSLWSRNLLNNTFIYRRSPPTPRRWATMATSTRRAPSAWRVRFASEPTGFPTPTNQGPSFGAAPFVMPRRGTILEGAQGDPSSGLKPATSPSGEEGLWIGQPAGDQPGARRPVPVVRGAAVRPQRPGQAQAMAGRSARFVQPPEAAQRPVTVLRRDAGPVSATCKIHSPASARRLTRIAASGPPYLTALPIRLTSAWVSSCRSPTKGAPPGSTATDKTWPASSATGIIIVAVSSTSAGRSKGAKPARRWPPSISAMRSRAANMASSVSHWASAARARSACTGSGASATIAATCPRNRASGVRRSWAMSLDWPRIASISSAMRSSMWLKAAAWRSNSSAEPVTGTRWRIFPATIASTVARWSAMRRPTSLAKAMTPPSTIRMIEPKPIRKMRVRVPR